MNPSQENRSVQQGAAADQHQFSSDRRIFPLPQEESREVSPPLPLGGNLSAASQSPENTELELTIQRLGQRFDKVESELSALSESVADHHHSPDPPPPYLPTLMISIMIIILGFFWWKSTRSPKPDDGEASFQPSRLDTRTLLRYLLSTVRHHAGIYGGFFVFPGLVVLLLAWAYHFFNDPALAPPPTLQLVAGIGAVLTIIGAYYASRADIAAQEALKHSKDIYISALNFANSLQTFVARVTMKLNELVGNNHKVVEIKALSVIPAFGSVGLATDYAQDLQPGRRFHHLLAEYALNTTLVNPMRLLTHEGIGCLRWITQLRLVTHPPVERDQSEGLRWEFDIERTSKYLDLNRNRPAWRKFEERVRADYFLQKCYVALVATQISGADVHLWEGRDEPIPFQFFVVRKSADRHLYFLFSGDMLYKSGLSYLPQKFNLGDILRLTRGYYLGEQESDLVEDFDRLFRRLYEDKSISRWVPSGQDCLDDGIDVINDAFPDRARLRFSATDSSARSKVRTVYIDISEPFSDFERHLRHFGDDRLEGLSRAFQLMDSLSDSVFGREE